MLCFPMFMKMEGQRVLVCGNGHHALDKIQRLQVFRPHLVAITPEPNQALAELGVDEVLTHAFTEEDLEPRPIFVVTGESREENHRIAQICRHHGVPVNAVDQPEDCDFFFPALITREPLTVGICTAGASPTAAVNLKKRIGAEIPEHIGEILTWLEELRPEIRRHCDSKARERQLLAAAVERAFSLDRALTETEISALYNEKNL